MKDRFDRDELEPVDDSDIMIYMLFEWLAALVLGAGMFVAIAIIWL